MVGLEINIPPVWMVHALQTPKCNMHEAEQGLSLEVRFLLEQGQETLPLTYRLMVWYGKHL